MTDPLFRDARGMDFRLQAASPCFDKGKKHDMILAYEGKRPDIGAYEGEERIQGRPYRYVNPEEIVPFKELPRITRIKVDGNIVHLWFSLPMDVASLKETNFFLVDQLIELPLKYKKLSKDGYTLTFSSEELFEYVGNNPGHLKLGLSKWPLAANGQALCSWASELPVSLKVEKQ